MITRGKKSASRGFVNNIILESLMTGDKYGYEIIKEVEEKSNGKIVLKQPSLYSSLKRFEQRGLITSYWGDSDVGGRRHYYSITELGKQYVANKSLSKSKSLSPTRQEENNEQKYDEVSLAELGDIFPTSSYEVDTSNGEDDLTDDYINTLTQENTNIDDQEDTPQSQDEENEELIDINNSQIIDDANIGQNVDKDITETMAKPVEIDEFELQNKSSFLQPDLFSNNEESNNITDAEIVLDHSQINNVKSGTESAENDNRQEEDKSIPLVKENSNIFFNWDEMKRKAVANKSFFDSKKTDEEIEESNDVENNENGENIQTSVNLEQEINLSIEDEADNKTMDDKTEPKNDAVYINSTPRFENNVNVTLRPSNPNTSIPKVSQNYEPAYFNKNEDIDYKNILGELYTTEKSDNYEDIVAGALNNEKDNDEPLIDYSVNTDVVLTPTQTIDDKLDRLLEDGFKFKPYRVESNDDITDKTTYVKTNKLTLMLCLFVGLLQIGSIVGLYYILKATEKLNSNHNIFLWIGIGIGVLIVLYGLIRYIVAPYHRKLATPEHFKFHFMLSLIAFVIFIVLTLGINMLFGMQLNNLNMFYTTLFVPMITALMIPIATILNYAFLSMRVFYK